jgi:hypothetical protein
VPINPIQQPAAPTVTPTGRAGEAVTQRPEKATPRTIGRAVLGQRVALIVAGVNYPGPGHRSVKVPAKHLTYFERAKNYTSYALTNGLVDRVVLFEFLSGKVVIFGRGAALAGEVRRPNDALNPRNYRYEVDGLLTLTPGPANVPDERRHQRYYMGLHELAKWRTGTPDGEVRKKEYDAWTDLTDPREDSLSVADVYASIASSVAGTVREVHFISHAFHEGPIIVNTAQQPSKEYDKDGRTDDFWNWDLRHVFGQKNLPRFRAAFTTDAVLTIWGCEDNPEAKKLIVLAQAKAAAGKPIPTELEKLKKLLTSTYAARLATVCGRTVYAPLPGTYSVHEGEQNDDPTPISFTPTVMHVNLTQCGHILEFYRKHLGIAFATTGAFAGQPTSTFGRGYAIYQPRYVP